MMTATTEELIARERVAFVLYKQAHPESVAESFETVGLPIVLEFRERADAVLAALAVPATGGADTRVYGACGVEGCTDCRPLYDSENNPIPATEETEWEYALMGDGDTEPYSDYSDDLDWLMDGAGSSVNSTTRAVRRRKAGPWVEVTP